MCGLSSGVVKEHGYIRRGWVVLELNMTTAIVYDLPEQMQKWNGVNNLIIQINRSSLTNSWSKYRWFGIEI